MSSTPTLTFQNIPEKRIQSCFIQALRAYPRLQDRRILVRKCTFRGPTMRARPAVNRHFFRRKQRHFIIEIKDSTELPDSVRMAEISEEVLTGWFAHELGHLMDYLDRPFPNLIGLGIGYYFFRSARIGAERTADLFAIEHGFAREIIATKKYILEHSPLPNRYKQRIENYYMSAEEVALLIATEEDDDLRMDTLI